MSDEAPIVDVPPAPRAWLYVQSTGNLYRPDGSYCATGYSGHLAGRNNPDMQNVANVGPLPIGFYRLGEVTSDKGPLTIRLNPDPLNEMHGRSGFLVHGDTMAHDASHGCIVVERRARIELARGGVIRVVDRPAAPEKLA